MEPRKSKSDKKEIYLQIYLPLSLFILLIIAVGILSILSTTNNFDLTAHWANISLVLLSVPALLVGFLILILLILLVIGQMKLIQWLPIQLKKLYAIFLTASAYIWNFTNKISKPVIDVQAKNASIKRLFRFKNTGDGGEHGE